MTSTSTKPIKLLTIVTRLNIGGPAVYVALLTEKLSQAPYGYDAVLLSGQIEAEEGDMSYYARQHGVTPLFVNDMARSIAPLSDIRTFWQLYRLMRQMQPDIVHTHTSKAGFIGRWAAKLAGVPLILHTFHGHTFHGYFSPLVSRVYITLEQLTARISDTLIALSQGLRRELADTYHIASKAHITVLPIGLDLQRFADTPRQHGAFRAQHGIAADVPLVGIVGRLVPVKNHALFLQAAALIHQQRPDVQFMLVGDGELRAELDAQIDALNLRRCVTITGWLSDLPLVYSDLDVCVISSVNEGTPVTIIEALAGGCPVVTTAVGGLKDLLDGGAFGKLVPSGDAPALAEAIRQTLDTKPDVSAAQAAMLDRYGIDRMMQDLDSLYRALLAQKRR
ncbi:MAG: glycosyltransferase family 4 protein [Armatimonadetes bacterium]|nr:glycosyltransferase family 4 protein [Anaerolineae bacterium]